MIRSCRDKETENVLALRPSRKFQAIQHRAERVVRFLDAATTLQDLSLPGFRLEKLTGDREGQFSIRIKLQYRVCFEWHEGNAHRVEIVDYH
jgi:proteic killer suppression protein